MSQGNYPLIGILLGLTARQATLAVSRDFLRRLRASSFQSKLLIIVMILRTSITAAVF